ncbi:MAG: hypothetical protein RR454_00365 [Clostridia bacterium]
MSKLYLVETNAGKEIWSFDTVNKIARAIANEEVLDMENLENVEDDSSWEKVNYSQLKNDLEKQYTEPHNIKVLDTKILRNSH